MRAAGWHGLCLSFEHGEAAVAGRPPSDVPGVGGGAQHDDDACTVARGRPRHEPGAEHHRPEDDAAVARTVPREPPHDGRDDSAAEREAHLAVAPSDDVSTETRAGDRLGHRRIRVRHLPRGCGARRGLRVDTPLARRSSRGTPGNRGDVLASGADATREEGGAVRGARARAGRRRSAAREDNLAGEGEQAKRREVELTRAQAVRSAVGRTSLGGGNAQGRPGRARTGSPVWSARARSVPAWTASVKPPSAPRSS